MAAFEPLQSPWWRQGDLEEVAANSIGAVEVTELKEFLKITSNDWDTEAARAILEATRMLQFAIGRAITTWSLRLHLSAFPGAIQLPYPPLQGSVTSIIYVDENGTEQTLSASAYQVQALYNRVSIIPSYSNSWPTTRTQYSAVKVAYLCGAATAAAVPADIKLAVKWGVKLNREDPLTGTVGRELRDGYDRLVRGLALVSL